MIATPAVLHRLTCTQITRLHPTPPDSTQPHPTPPALTCGCHTHRSHFLLQTGGDYGSGMDVKNMCDYLGWLYYQYLLITGIYVLEPWEKSIFNTVLFTMVAMVVYTSYVFVPIHVRLALEFFSGLCGEQPESTVALMN
ncbi:serine palmitoyltransferase small subunit B isoform X1 [Brachyhypopomus gauderio]|uniref:serine palmitoyltransferase small subunit B isoform X1 n=2 Tax=Brachyhypopomus gauderio TaxID=698409 RepID=UPI0040438324